MKYKIKAEDSWRDVVPKVYSGDGWVPAGGRDSSETSKIPYGFPTKSPYNVPVYCTTPSPDGSNKCLHPDVVVFDQPWRGHRFWMAVTPYPEGSDILENPCILVSEDGFNWRVPEGLTNPIAPWPGAATNNTQWYNSDTDMVYDAEADMLVCSWRQYKRYEYEAIIVSTSTDGVTWSNPVEVLRVAAVLNGSGAHLATAASQSIVKAGPNDWRLFTVDDSDPNVVGDRMWSSSEPTSPFTNPQILSYTGTTITPYHGDVIWHKGTFWMLMNSGSNEFPGRSVDGVNWKIGPMVLSSRDNKWDKQLYRSCMFPHENGTDVRIWYSTLVGPYSQRVGYTQVPISLWPSL